MCVSHLRDDPQRLPQAVQADLSDILSSYVDVALLRLIEAEQEPHNGALPATRGKTTISIILYLSGMETSDGKAAPYIQTWPYIQSQVKKINVYLPRAAATNYSHLFSSGHVEGHSV